MSTFKNPMLTSLISDMSIVDNIILNGRSEVKRERDRSDGRPSRLYYKAYFKSDLFGKAITRVIWQNHTAEGDKVVCAWKNTPSPSAIEANEGNVMAGVKLIELVLTKSYSYWKSERLFSAKKLSLIIFPSENIEVAITKRLKDLKLIQTEEEAPL